MVHRYWNHIRPVFCNIYYSEIYLKDPGMTFYFVTGQFLFRSLSKVVHILLYLQEVWEKSRQSFQMGRNFRNWASGHYVWQTRALGRGLSPDLRTIRKPNSCLNLDTFFKEKWSIFPTVFYNSRASRRWEKTAITDCWAVSEVVCVLRYAVISTSQSDWMIKSLVSGNVFTTATK